MNAEHAGITAKKKRVMSHRNPCSFFVPLDVMISTVTPPATGISPDNVIGGSSDP